MNAYGVRKPDSDVFLKTPEIKEDFQYSLAHDEILMMLLGGEDDEIINFIVGIMPGMSVENRANVIEQVKNARRAKKLPESTEASENA